MREFGRDTLNANDLLVNHLALIVRYFKGAISSLLLLGEYVTYYGRILPIPRLILRDHFFGALVSLHRELVELSVDCNDGMTSDGGGIISEVLVESFCAA